MGVKVFIVIKVGGMNGLSMRRSMDMGVNWLRRDDDSVVDG